MALLARAGSLRIIFYGKLFLNIKYPITPETNEPSKMPRRSSNIRLTLVSSNESDPMNKLIVKPIPQSAAVPYKDIQDISLGSWVSFNFIASKQNPKTPTCLPINKPRAIPNGTP